MQMQARAGGEVGAGVGEAEAEADPSLEHRREDVGGESLNLALGLQMIIDRLSWHHSF